MVVDPRGSPGWTVEFLNDDGREPARSWLESLDDPTKQSAVIAAVEHVLASEGPDVCRTEWGRNLGGGLYELRIRHSAEEVRRIRSVAAAPSPTARRAARIVLRIYFTTAPERVILLIGGYDKGRLGGGRRQQRSIEQARRLARRVRRAR